MTLTINAATLRDFLLSSDGDDTAKDLLRSQTMAGGLTAAMQASNQSTMKPDLKEETTLAYLGCHLSISQDGHPSFDPNTLGVNTQTPIGAFLIPISRDEDTHLLLLACPRCPPSDGNKEHPSVTTLMGTTGESSFTRTDTFDSSAIATGDSSFTALSYTGTSPVSSLRFTSFLVPARKDASDYDALFADEKDKIRSKDPFRSRPLEQWCIATDATSTGSPGTKRYSCAVPAIFPIPFGHNLTTMSTIPISADMGPSFLEACGADSDWLTKLPAFKLWIAAVRENPKHFTPTLVTDLRLDSASNLTEHHLAVSVTRQLFADWDKSTNKSDDLFDLTFGSHHLHEDEFPPATITRDNNDTSKLPSWDTPFSFVPTTPPPLQQHHHTNPANPAISTATPPQTVTNIVSQPSAGISIKNHKVQSWQLMAICSFPGRTPTLDPRLAKWTFPLTSSQGIPVGSVSALGTIGPVPPTHQSHFACAPLSQGMRTSLLEHTAANAAQAFQSRFERARTIQGKQNEVVEKIRSVSGSHSQFWKPAAWEPILAATFSASKLDREIAPVGFNILTAASIDPSISCTPEGYPTFPPTGAESFSTISTIIALGQWLILAVTDPDYYQHTILYQGLAHIDSLCDEHSFAHRWSAPNFNPGMATLAVIQSIHDLWSCISQVAILAIAVQPQDIAIVRTDGSPGEQATLCPPTVTDSGVVSSLEPALASWLQRTRANFAKAGAVVDSFDGALAGPSSINKTIYHALFIKHEPTTPGSTPLEPELPPSGTPTGRGKRKGGPKDPEPDKGSPSKKPRVGLLRQAPTERAVCKPAGSNTLSSLIAKFKTGELKPYTFQKGEVPTIGKFVKKTACPSYLLGAICESQDCGYHLNIVPLEAIEGKEPLRKNFTKFRAWVTSQQAHFVFTPEALKHPYYKSTEDNE